ncbi:replication initiator protein A [Deinococcus rubellus]|uniref:replication initiator protein A n=1 Tax=Deinococcus rubellus TaxID=1889240 RepID=UPI0031F02202
MSNSSNLRLDDLNISRLNLIVALDQIDNQRQWAVMFEDGDRIVKISCQALPELGVPHGIDNDVSAALIDHFNSLGQPETGVLELSATQLLRLCAFHSGGTYYIMLRQSLERMHSASYSVSGGWRDHPNSRWTHAKFHFIESLDYSAREAGTFDERTIIRVRLAEAIVSSLRSGYTKPLDFAFMYSLSRPRTRILFRVLDAVRVNPEKLDEVVNSFEVDLMAWADQCKIPNGIPGNVRRALEGPHQELLKRGYLREVTYLGRGKSQRIRYDFHPAFTPLDPALIRRLRQHGVVDGVARQLANEYSKALLLDLIDRFERLVSTGVLVVKKTPAHALVHLIRNPDQYPLAVTETPGPARRLPKVKPPELLTDPRTELEAEFLGKTPEQRSDAVLARLTLLYPRKFNVTELDVLRQKVLRGDLDPAVLLSQGAQAMANLDA